MQYTVFRSLTSAIKIPMIEGKFQYERIHEHLPTIECIQCPLLHKQKSSLFFGCVCLETGRFSGVSGQLPERTPIPNGHNPE